MRAAVLAFGFLLAGCAGPAPADTQSEPSDQVDLVTPPLLVLADGTYPFNELSGTPGVYTALEVYDVVTQVAVNPCSYEGGAYFNNRPIPTAGAKQPTRNGTMSIQFDWTDADYPQPTLVLGYRAPGMASVVDSPRIARGQPLELRIEPRGHDAEGAWQLFACLNRSDDAWGDPTWQPGPFIGSFTVRATFQGDPEAPAEDPADDGQRTSQS